jgi:hypothetical protein
MHINEDVQSDYEVCFTVSPDKRTDQIACVKPDELFHDNIPEDVRFNVKADSGEEAE